MPENKSSSKREVYDVICVYEVFRNCRSSLTVGLVHKLRVIVHSYPLMRSYKFNLPSLPHVDEWRYNQLL
jgi:hypothetical protein